MGPRLGIFSPGVTGVALDISKTETEHSSVSFTATSALVPSRQAAETAGSTISTCTECRLCSHDRRQTINLHLFLQDHSIECSTKDVRLCAQHEPPIQVRSHVCVIVTRQDARPAGEWLGWMGGRRFRSTDQGQAPVEHCQPTELGILVASYMPA